MKNKSDAFLKVLQTMDDLRSKCPWDKIQTNETLRLLTIEETYELADAILMKDTENIKKELGDLLLHLVFYAKIGSETGAFDIRDVAESIAEKLIYRHPHVFGDTDVRNNPELVKKIDNTMSNIDHTVLEIQQSSQLLNQNLEALKHTWPINNYFKKLEKKSGKK